MTSKLITIEKLEIIPKVETYHDNKIQTKDMAAFNLNSLIFKALDMGLGRVEIVRIKLDGTPLEMTIYGKDKEGKEIVVFYEDRGKLMEWEANDEVLSVNPKIIN